MKWRSEFDVNELMRGLAAGRTVNDDGSVQVKTLFSLDEWHEILRTALDDDAVTPPVKEKALAFAARQRQELTPKEFISFYSAERERLRKNVRKFVVALPVWGRTSLLDIKLDAFDSSCPSDMEVEPDVRSKVVTARLSVKEEMAEHFIRSYGDYDQYRLEVLAVFASSAEDAFFRGHREVSRKLALLNLVDGSFTLPMFTTGLIRPVHDALIAPTSTVHDEKGDLAYKGIWVDIWNPDKGRISQPSTDRLKLVGAQARKLRSSIEQLPWKKNALVTLEEYYQVFSEHDQGSAVVGAWRLLESVGGRQNEKDETFIRRGAVLSSSFSAMYEIGKHLKARRNMLVHQPGTELETSRIVSFQFREFLRPLLVSFLLNDEQFQHVDELWDFCDDLQNPARLAAKQRVLDAVRRSTTPPENPTETAA